MRYRDSPGPLAVAHRGGAGLAAENTMAAFARSYALGVRYLETDVRLSADGRLIAFHDALLNRVAATSGRVRAQSAARLATLSVLGGGPVAVLDDVLAAYPDCCFTIDVKDPAAIAPLARLLRAHGSAGRVCAAAARGSWLRALRAQTGPELTTALSWRDLARLAAPHSGRGSDGRGGGPAGGRGGGSGGSAGGRFADALFAHVPIRLGRLPVFRDDLLLRAHEAGVRVLVWTVNDPPTMHRLLDSGVDGIITDRPDLLRDVLIARGEWHTPDSYATRAGTPS